GEFYLRLLVLAIVALLVVLIALLRDRIPAVENLGYGAVALLSFVASASIAVPVPGILSVCAGGVLLHPFLVGLVAAVAEGLGELTGYMVGYSGRGLVEQHRLYRRVESWMERRGWLLLLLVSVVPNPIFDLVGIAAGAVRFPLWRFLLVVWVGKSIKSVSVAYLCALGVEGIATLLRPLF
ncbi:MAG: VTT domain-containing protein, partial [Dehalococcoidia bacterium]